jgi:hypothetical protein
MENFTYANNRKHFLTTGSAKRQKEAPLEEREPAGLFGGGVQKEREKLHSSKF